METDFQKAENIRLGHALKTLRQSIPGVEIRFALAGIRISCGEGSAQQALAPHAMAVAQSCNLVCIQAHQ